MYQLQVENEHYSVYNWLNLISSSTAIFQQFSPKVGTVIADRVYLLCKFFSILACYVTKLLQCELNKNCQKVMGIMFVFYLLIQCTAAALLRHSVHTYILNCISIYTHVLTHILEPPIKDTRYLGHNKS